ncbi:hypothetical protein MMC18_001458 [Xylographa bjoerkii]|nr:hypothetical protein [Xylographa bjoerkii]
MSDTDSSSSRDSDYFGTAQGPGQWAGTICEDEEGDLVGSQNDSADNERTEFYIIQNHTPNILWYGEGPNARGGTLYVDENDIITDEDGEEVYDVNYHVREKHVVRIIHEYYDYRGLPISSRNEDWESTHDRREEAGLSVTSSEGSEEDESHEGNQNGDDGNPNEDDNSSSHHGNSSSHHGSDSSQRDGNANQDNNNSYENNNTSCENSNNSDQNNNNPNQDNNSRRNTRSIPSSSSLSSLPSDTLSPPRNAPPRSRAPRPLPQAAARSRRRRVQRRRTLITQPPPVRSGDPHFAERAYRPTTRPQQAGAVLTRPQRTRRAPERYGFELDVWEARAV